MIRLLIMVAVGASAFAGLWIYSILTKPTPESLLAKLEKEVKPKGGTIFKAVLQDKPVTLLLLDCSLYLLEFTPQTIKRNRVLTTGFYFGLAGCTSQSIAMEDGYLSVYLANLAIGAGGGNTSGGYYRSKDGVAWEKKTAQGWRIEE